MEISPELVDRLVDRVVQKIESSQRSTRGVTQGTNPASSWSSAVLHTRREKKGLFQSVSEAVAAAETAQVIWRKIDRTKKKEIIECLRTTLLEHSKELSELAVSETGLGRVEDKIQKNNLVITRTPGVEALETWSTSGESGLTLQEYAPFGVIGAITPTTNPSETIINNGIGMIAAGNTVVFNAHPKAQKVSARTIEIMNKVITDNGGPEHVVGCVEKPTIESATELMNHPRIALVVVTGGPQVVRAAMKTGKKVIAAGPGNPPVVVDETANIEKAAKDIVLGASLDNNVVCIVEKECIVVKSVAEELKKAMQRYGAFYLNQSQRDRLQEVLITSEGVNKDLVGRDASVILRQIGISAGKETRLVICDALEAHPFVQKELLLPVLPIVTVENFEEAIQMAKRVEHDYRHTAVIHSKDISRIHTMGALMNCSIFVSNAPSYAGLGLGGEGFTSFTIASPTGEGLTTARNFARLRRFTLAGHLHMVST